MFARSLRPVAARFLGTRTIAGGAGFKIPDVKNEPMLDYKAGSAERAALQAALAKMKTEVVEIPCIVGGKEVYTGDIVEQVMPTDHGHVLAKIHMADKATVDMGVASAMAAKDKWESMPFVDRAAIFLKAADLIATKYRAPLMASVMLGSGKNPWQAEIDAAAELIDFLRFNVKFAEEIYAGQPPENSFGIWNRVQYRPLEGFVFALSPFNFCAIGGNLPSSAALMGNTVVWKPSTTVVHENWLTYKILEEAGLPGGVINFLPGSGRLIGAGTIDNPDFGGLHFTGSTNTFNTLWKQIAGNLDMYKSYPRVVGETGGKNFHFIHKSIGDSEETFENAVNNTIRGAFEYNGQKCSACSRLYVPASLWPRFKQRLQEEIAQIKVGQPDDFETFVTAVIDQSAYNTITSAIAEAAASDECEIVAGGTYDDSKGFFIDPTVIATTDPYYATMKNELFGPVLTTYVYPDEEYEETLAICDATSEYALTGALFARDREAQMIGEKALERASGNFYINDKSTGAVVGQQPFGGARASGTNDKAGSGLNLIRWVSARAVKENFIPLSGWRYPHMTKD